MRGQLANLLAVEKQLPRALGLVVHAVGLKILGDVAAEQPDLALVHLRVRLFQARLADSQALDLGAGEDEASLDLLDQVVLVAGRAVAGDDVDAAALGGFGFAAGFAASFLAMLRRSCSL